MAHHTMTRHRIYVGIPVYRGTEHVAESLRSLQQQTHRDFVALISVDGNDRETAQACSPFLADPRFRLEVQPRQLGWAANFNLVLSRCEADFFCYFQQDDLIDPSYFETLLEVAVSSSAPAIAYCDIKYFGAADWLYEQESITGNAYERVRKQAQVTTGTPLRGLIRRDAVRAAGSVRVKPNDYGEDVIWLVKVARYGDFIRIPKALYAKRWHEHNISGNWLRVPQAARRAKWIEFCAGLLQAALPAAQTSEQQLHLWFDSLERLAGGQSVYTVDDVTPDAKRKLVADLVQELRRTCEVDVAAALRLSWDGLTELALSRFALAPPSDRSRPLAMLRALVRRSANRAMLENARRILAERLAIPIGTDLDLAQPDVRLALSGHWGEREAWGRWTTGTHAEWTISVAHRECRRLCLHALVHPFLGETHRVVSIQVSVNDTIVATWPFDLNAAGAHQARWCEAEFDAGLCAEGRPIRISFLIDNPMSPFALGLSDDRRSLGLAFHRLRIEPVG